MLTRPQLTRLITRVPHRRMPLLHASSKPISDTLEGFTFRVIDSWQKRFALRESRASRLGSIKVGTAVGPRKGCFMGKMVARTQERRDRQGDLS